MTRNPKTGAQFSRYALVGIVTNLTGYLVFLMVTALGVEPKLAMTVLYAIGAALGFLWNRVWTFSHSGSVLGAGFRYGVAQLAGYVTNFSILLLFYNGIGMPYQVVQAVAIVVVAVLLFVLAKYFVFAPESQGAAK